MREKDFQKLIREELMRYRYRVEEYPSVYYNGAYFSGDLRIRDTDVIIEIKAEAGDIRKGIGQCFQYEAAGKDSVLIIENEYMHMKEIFSDVPELKMPLLQAHVSVSFGEYEFERFECIANEQRYKRLFDRIVNQDHYGDYIDEDDIDLDEEQSKSAYEKFGPSIDIDLDSATDTKNTQGRNSDSEDYIPTVEEWDGF